MLTAVTTVVHEAVRVIDRPTRVGLSMKAFVAGTDALQPLGHPSRALSGQASYRGRQAPESPATERRPVQAPRRPADLRSEQLMTGSVSSTALFDGSARRPHRAASRREFLDAMACLTSPVTVITTVSVAGRPMGSTVSAVTSLSLDPPMVAIALDGRSSLLAAIRTTRLFAVNVLSARQAHVAEAFASRRADRFVGVSWHESAGLPRLEGVVGWLVVSLDATVPGGDHQIVVGRVEEAVGLEGPPLAYVGRRYATHTLLDVAGDPGSTDSERRAPWKEELGTLLQRREQ